MIIDRDIFNIQREERDKYLNKILNSKSKKKIVVAGPGTGKTYLFEKIIEKKEGNYLILTFIKNLINRLDEKFCKKAECKTFHAYCRKLLQENRISSFSKNLSLYDKLTKVILSDFNVLNNSSRNIDYGHLFKNISSENYYIKFYFDRSKFYSTVSFDDSVYRVFNYFKSNSNKIPVYDYILVDEYQDFCKLEVKFLDILSTKSPILIVGDDDQALYEGRFSKPFFLREKYNSNDYEKFELPYCSRCTEVVIKAFNDIINEASKINYLRDRVKKKFFCYLPDKIDDCKYFKKIVWCNCSTHTKKAPYISRFIDLQVKEFLKSNQCFGGKADYEVLIVGPQNYLKIICSDFLIKKEYNVFKDKAKEDSLNKFDGYKMLLENINSVLGWRIILEFINFKDKINFLRDNLLSKDFINMIPQYIYNQQFKILNILKELKENANSLTKEDIKILNNFFKMEISKIKEKIITSDDAKKVKKEKGKINIKFSTYNGCKGLSANHVFILGLNNKVLPKNKYKIKDIEICRFLVALTRAVKSCCLVSTKFFSANRVADKSVFIDWINPNRIEEVEVNKEYWNSLKMKNGY